MLKIPMNVNTVAIKITYDHYFISEKEGKKIAVLKKKNPEYSITITNACTNKLNLWFYLDMKLRGGVLLDSKNRKLRYAKAENDTLHGYLVFERYENEWIVSDKEPEAFFYIIYYIQQKECGANYEIISTKNVFAIEKGVDNELHCGIAGLGILANAKEPAVIEYKRTIDYDGCRDVVEKVKISWNNGSVIVQPVEELKRVL